MPCNHKFQRFLNLESIDFEPTTLIVGTFIPEWPPGDTVEWFYGKTSNNSFWDVLPGLYGAPSLLNARPEEWKEFCRDRRIAVTDLISSIDDADQGNSEHNNILAGFADKAIVYNFDDFVFVDVVQILQRHSAIKNVYLTRGITEAFWKHLWNPVMQYCSRKGLHERRLLTPAEQAVYQHSAYNVENPGHAMPLLADYILMRWKEEWHF